MDKMLALLCDLIVVVFDLLVYMKLTKFKRDNGFTRAFAYCACGVILAAYFVCTYVLGVASSIASFACMSLPSLILFWLLSAYKGARFFVTFCFVDTVTLALGFFGRWIGLAWGNAGGVISCVLMIILFSAIYITAYPYFPRYRKLLEIVKDGWNVLVVSTVLIYFLMVFAAAFPKPLVERPEYLQVYALLSIVILSFYVVFITTLLQKRKLYELNEQLVREQVWHRIAYVDALTGVGNRMAYVERINELERGAQEDAPVHVMTLDIDDFKQINDTRGHHAGDQVLQEVAQLLKDVFPGCEVFRTGGDEFSIIAVNAYPEELQEKIERVNRRESGSIGSCTLSIGLSAVDFSERNAMENAFIRADKAMYREKSGKKA